MANNVPRGGSDKERNTIPATPKTKKSQEVLNVNRPEDFNDFEDFEKKEKAPEDISGYSPEIQDNILNIRSFLDKRQLPELKAYLKERGGELLTVISTTRTETNKNIKLLSARRVWGTDEVRDYLEKCVKEDQFFDALQFIKANEQYLLEVWVEDLLEKQKYHDAAVLIEEYAKSKPSKIMNEEEFELDAEIDKVLLDGVEKELRGKSDEFKIVQFDLRHDRIWNAVHRGYYQQAAEMCDQLYEEKTGIKKKKFVGPQMPAVVPESPASIQKRHEKELIAALPSSPYEMKKIFQNLPDLLGNFEHLANLGEYGEEREDYIKSLQGIFQYDVDKLFKQKKIVIQEGGGVAAQEELLGIIDDLGDLGFHLYMDPNTRENKLYLLMEDQAADKGYWRIDLRKLSPDDIALDNNFDRITEPKTLVQDPEKTLVTEPADYAWTTKVITISPNKAQQLREAA